MVGLDPGGDAARANAAAAVAPAGGGALDAGVAHRAHRGLALGLPEHRRDLLGADAVVIVLAADRQAEAILADHHLVALGDLAAAQRRAVDRARHRRIVGQQVAAAVVGDQHLAALAAGGGDLDHQGLVERYRQPAAADGCAQAFEGAGMPTMVSAVRAPRQQIPARAPRALALALAIACAHAGTARGRDRARGAGAPARRRHHRAHRAAPARPALRHPRQPAEQDATEPSTTEPNQAAGHKICSSSTAFMAIPGDFDAAIGSAYMASKAAVIRFTETLAAEARPGGVRVFAVSPGTVKTDLTAALFPESWDDSGHWSSPALGAELIASIASGALDALSGRYIRATADDWRRLAERSDEIVDRDLHVVRLRLDPEPDADPVSEPDADPVSEPTPTPSPSPSSTPTPIRRSTATPFAARSAASRDRRGEHRLRRHPVARHLRRVRRAGRRDHGRGAGRAGPGGVARGSSSRPPITTRRTASSSSSTSRSAAPPRSRRPAHRAPSNRAGTLGDRGDGVGGFDPEPRQPAESGGQRRDGPGERAVRAAGHAAADRERRRAEPARAVASGCGGDRVADQADAARRRGERQPDQLVGDVDAVGDQLDGDPRRGERGPGKAGRAGADRRHRVEQMRDRGGAGAERARRLRGGRLAVTERGDDPAPDAELDQLQRARELGGKRDHPHRAGVEQARKQARIRRAQMLDGVRARAQRGQERAFEVDADDRDAGDRGAVGGAVASAPAGPGAVGGAVARAGRHAPDPRQRRQQFILGGGDQRRLIGRPRRRAAERPRAPPAPARRRAGCRSRHSR